MDNRALETAKTDCHGVCAKLILQSVQKFLKEQQHVRGVIIWSHCFYEIKNWAKMLIYFRQRFPSYKKYYKIIHLDLKIQLFLETGQNNSR